MPAVHVQVTDEAALQMKRKLEICNLVPEAVCVDILVRDRAQLREDLARAISARDAARREAGHQSRIASDVREILSSWSRGDKVAAGETIRSIAKRVGFYLAEPPSEMREGA